MSEAEVPKSVTIAAVPREVRLARAFVAGVLGQSHPNAAVAVLLDRELVTNSVRHSGSAVLGGLVTVTVAACDGGVRVEVTRLFMRLAGGEGIDPDRISFVKVLKHVRRSVMRQSAQAPAQVRQFMPMMAAKVRRKPGNGARRLREADRCRKRPASKYSFRKAGQARRPTRRVAAKVLMLHPAIVRI
jgi:hypothetical protein